MRYYHTIDYNQPRFRRKVVQLLNQGFYSYLRAEYPDLSFKNAEIKKIVDTFNNRLKKEIAETREGVLLPEQLGHIFVGSFKKRNESEIIDPKLSAKHNLAIQYTPWASDDWICKICYSNYAKRVLFKNSQLWSFESATGLRNVVSAAFRKDHKKYVILDNTRKICHVYMLESRRFRAIQEEKRNNPEE